MIKICYANMRAALVTYLVFNIIALGRFDLDMYLFSYLMIYLTPLTGFSVKLEQGFELASYYYARHIPKELLGHPEAQKYLNKRIGKARISFNLVYKLYENILGYFIGALETLQTASLGPRALARLLFGGLTPTEHVVLAMEKVADAAGAVPGVVPVINACEHVLTHRYSDGLFLPKK